MASGRRRWPLSSFRVTWVSYSRPRVRPEDSSTRSRIISPQLPWVLACPFSASVRLRASSCICWFRLFRWPSCSIRDAWARVSSLWIWSTRRRKSASCSRNGLSMPSRPCWCCSCSCLPRWSSTFPDRFSNSCFSWLRLCSEKASFSCCPASRSSRRAFSAPNCCNCASVSRCRCCCPSSCCFSRGTWANGSLSACFSAINAASRAAARRRSISTANSAATAPPHSAASATIAYRFMPAPC